MAKAKRLTKRCTRDLTHDATWRPFIPDDQDECDRCLLADVGLLKKQKGLPGCVDPWGMATVYDQDDVIAVIRKIRSEGA